MLYARSRSPELGRELMLKAEAEDSALRMEPAEEARSEPADAARLRRPLLFSRCEPAERSVRSRSRLTWKAASFARASDGSGCGAMPPRMAATGSSYPCEDEEVRNVAAEDPSSCAAKRLQRVLAWHTYGDRLPEVTGYPRQTLAQRWRTGATAEYAPSSAFDRLRSPLGPAFKFTACRSPKPPEVRC